MKQLLLLIPLLLSIANAWGAERITALITITNAPTTNGMGFVVNGALRTWTNSVFNTTSQIFTNDTVEGIATNLYQHLVATPPANVVASLVGADQIRLDARTGSPLLLQLTNYFDVTYSTQTVTTAMPLIVPPAAIPSSRRLDGTEGIVDWLNLNSTKSIFENSATVARLVGLTNAQTIPGDKVFTGIITLTNRAGAIVTGTISFTNLTGIVNLISNGVWWDGILRAPVFTNGVNYGNAFRSPGSGATSEQFGTSAAASGEGSLAIGNNSLANGEQSVAIGAGSIAAPDNSIAIGYSCISTGAIAIGTAATAYGGAVMALGIGAVATNSGQITIGRDSDYLHIPGNLNVLGQVRAATFSTTNNFPAQSDVAFGRAAVTSLANGNNAAVPVGTNVFVEVSGPTGAFTLNGINAGGAMRDGKLIVILNQTGQDMTIAHQSGTDPTAANRIISLTGADRTTTGNGAATLIYSGDASRWILVSFDP